MVIDMAKLNINFLLPVLEGSDEQIAQAETIRAKFIDEFNDMAEFETVEDWINIKEKMPSIWEYLIQNKSAKFWIEKENTLLSWIINVYMRI